MKGVADLYQKGMAEAKDRNYTEALSCFMQVFQEEPEFLSVCYYIGKCRYFLKEFDEAEKFLLLHTERETERNQGQAWKLLTRTYIIRQDRAGAEEALKQAERHGAKKLAGLRERIDKIEDSESEEPKLKFRFIQLAKNGTPIAKANAGEYAGVKFFINGMSDEQKNDFCDGKWHALEVTKPRAVKFKGFMSVSLLDDRGYYRKYLPKLPSLYLRSAFNDYLEEDRFFKTKWEKSRVFSLLLTRIFSQETIEKLLVMNDLLDTQARQHLKGCDDLVCLKRMGEVLPLSSEHLLENAEQLRKFGFLCSKNCNGTVHLKDKCDGELLIWKLLHGTTRMKLPFRHPPKDFEPTKEQFRFIHWIFRENHRIVSLLGVGGSGKTYTLGQILDHDRVLALAPTHKARLNLEHCGFRHNDTVQKVICELENSRSGLVDGDDYDVIVIDEISMVTQSMLVTLLKYIGNDYRFIFLGDDRQLPPVSQDEDALEVCGNVMKLLIDYGAHFDFQANLRCRDERVRMFIAQCRLGNTGYLRQLNVFRQSSVDDMIAYKLKHPSVDECMIIAYRNATVGRINEKFFNALSRNRQKVIPFECKNGCGRGGFFIGAEVVFYRNDDQYQKYGYTNSEFGRIVGLDIPCEKNPNGKVIVQTEEKTYELPVWRAKEDLLLAYALTIHKAQGSGADRVYVLEATDYSLAYTAVSRTKGELYFTGMTLDDLCEALETPTEVRRNITDFQR